MIPDDEGQIAVDKEQHWSRFARDFEERNAYVAGKQNIDEIRCILSTLALTGRVLELGCGNGTYTGILAEKAEHVLATDLSEDMVASARVRLKDLSNVQVERQDAFALSYPDGVFDAVVMVNLLHVVPDPQNVVAECRRVLKPGGQIVVVSFTTDGMGLLAKLGLVYRYRRAYGKRPKASQVLTVAGTRSMVGAAGFAVRDADLIGVGCKAVFVHAAKQELAEDRAENLPN